MSEPPRKLPLRRILVGAFVLPWRNRIAVLRAIGVPMLALVAAFLAWQTLSFSSPSAQWATWATFVVSIAWLAIATHRLVLTHAWNPQSALSEFSFRRFAWFVGALVFIMLAVLVITMIVAIIAVNIVIGPRYVAAGEPPPSATPQETLEWIQRFGSAVAYFISARISLVLPAIAMDRKPDLVEAWRCSRRNSWRLAVIVCALPLALDEITAALWRNGSTTLEIALLGILTGIFSVIGFVALSLSYFELTHESAPPPTHPPG